MKFPFNPNPIAIKLTSIEVIELYQYLNVCNIKGFTHTNNFNRIQPMREYFLRFNLKEIAYKIYIQILKKSTNNIPQNKPITIKILLTQQEQHTLSIMFRRVECSPLVTAIQSKLLINLTNIKNDD